MEFLLTGEFFINAYDPNFNPYSERLMAEINNITENGKYGTGIKLFTHIVRVEMEDIKNPTRQFIRSTKEILISSDIKMGELNLKNYDKFKSKILDYFLECINIASKMKSGPKDFNYSELIEDIKKLS